LQQLNDYRPEIERVVNEGYELGKTSAALQVATGAEQLQLKYTALLDTAKVDFQ